MYLNYLFRGDTFIAKCYTMNVGTLHDLGESGDTLVQLRDGETYLYRLIKEPETKSWVGMLDKEDSIKHYLTLILLLG